jgi:probable HAF family extracellular repeat protein
MTMTYHFKIRRLCLAATLTAGLSFISPVSAENSWTLTPLGSLGGSTKAFGINNTGQVVGGSYLTTGDEHAFMTGPHGSGMRDLGVFGGNESRATAINSSGQVVGTSTTGEGEYRPSGFFYPDSHAFITSPNGTGIRDIGTLVVSDLGQLYQNISSSAAGINDAGQVIGTFATRDCPCGSFITGPNGVDMTRLSNAGTYLSYPSDINNAGRVVGGGVITGPNGVGWTPLGGAVYGINDAGQVVGSSFTAGGAYHAFITGPNGLGMRDLGTLDGDLSVATDINSSGQVVGYFSSPPSASEHRAFITGPNGEGITDLSSIVLPDGDHLREAVRINDMGQFIANSSNSAYLLTPIPEPASYALMFAGLGLVSFMARRKNRRVQVNTA